MGFAVGVDFGSSKTTVAIARWDDDCAPTPQHLQVAASVPSVIYLGDNDELVIGRRAQELGSAKPHRVIRDFKRRLGDPVPILADGWCESTESIVAALLRRVVDDAADHEGGAPDAVAVTYPAQWGPYKQALLAEALVDAGLNDVLLVSETVAAIMNAALVANSPMNTAVVYDLGGGSFDAAVMTRGTDGGFEMVGTPQGIEWLGGSDFDQAIFTRVREAAGLENVDATDQVLLTEMRRLRRFCTQAKESLSLDTEVTIAVTTPRRRQRIRLVRSEFEELIRDPIEDTLEATRRAIGSAGLSVHDIDAIVLVGGSSRIPLVVQMISAEFSRPIIVDSRPDASISLGAARFAVAALQTQRSAFIAPEASIATDAVADPGLVEQTLGDAATSARDADIDAAAHQRVLPSPIPVSDRGGRHRRRARHRHGPRTAGVVAAAAGLILAGSSLAASQAADSNVPTSGSLSPVGGVQTTTPATAPPVTEGPTTASERQVDTTPAVSETGPGDVNSPAVVDRSDLVGANVPR